MTSRNESSEARAATNEAERGGPVREAGAVSNEGPGGEGTVRKIAEVAVGVETIDMDALSDDEATAGSSERRVETQCRRPSWNSSDDW